VTETALPPGQEFNAERGKALPPGIESKFGSLVPGVDPVTEPALPPGQEFNAERGKALPPGIESKFGPLVPGVDPVTETALPPGQEFNSERGKPIIPPPASEVEGLSVGEASGLAGGVAGSAGVGEASGARPTFKSDRANQYVATYDSYIEEFKVTYEAMKHNDLSNYQTVVAKAQELRSQGEQLADELSPEEQRKFADYLNRKSDELAQYASQNQ
jgi:hypothetical protein